MSIPLERMLGLVKKKGSNGKRQVCARVGHQELGNAGISPSAWKELCTHVNPTNLCEVCWKQPHGVSTKCVPLSLENLIQRILLAAGARQSAVPSKRQMNMPSVGRQDISLQQCSRGTSIGSLPSENPEEPRRTLRETPAEASRSPSERQISSREARGGLSPPSDCDPLELSNSHRGVFVAGAWKTMVLKAKDLTKTFASKLAINLGSSVLCCREFLPALL